MISIFDEIMIIREAQQNDIDEIFRLSDQLDSKVTVKKDVFYQIYPDIIFHPDSNCLVAEKDGKILGYVLGYSHNAFYSNGITVWVDEIVVERSLRNRGIGKKLMSSFEAWAQEKNSILISLATNNASGFYEKIGYKDSARYYKKYL